MFLMVKQGDSSGVIVTLVDLDAVKEVVGK